jgi:HSP20 family protein
VRWHRSERSFGNFTRSFKLLSPVDNDKIAADYRNGLLIVTLPKAAAARRHDIKVESH